MFQTWSGDNRTNWDTLRYNTRMGLGMSLSGLYNIGHDVGGFSGDKPDPELFVRWVQNGVMHPDLRSTRGMMIILSMNHGCIRK